MPLQLPLVEDLSSLLQRCNKDKSSCNALKLYAYMCKSGLDSHTSMGYLLVTVFIEIDRMRLPYQIFDRFEYRCSKISLDSLIIEYVKCGKSSHALLMYQKVSEEYDRYWYHFNEYALGALLKACIAMADLNQGRRIHAEIVRRHLLEQNVFLASAIMDMYGKCGFLAKAQEVFDSVSIRNVVLWNTIISVYMENGYVVEALDAFACMQHEGFSPDVVTFICCLKACGKIGAVSNGEEIHVEIARNDIINKNVFIESSLINMYSKCGSLVKAREVFDRLPTRNVVLWNVLISGYAENGCDEEALHCFLQMQREGVLCDDVTILCILKACGGLGAIEIGQGLHAEVMKKAYETNFVIGSSLVDMYAKCSMLLEAQKTFDKLPFKDAVSWTTLISGYVEHGYAEDAFNYFEEMEKEDIYSGVVTYLCILKACGITQARDKGLEMHMAISMKGLETEVCIINSLITFYAKCGLLLEACGIFQKIPIQDIVSWNALISGYLDNGCGMEALQCFRQLQEKGILGDSGTFVFALKACSIIGATVESQDIHTFICMKGLETDLIISNAIIEVYAKCGFLVESKQLIGNVPIQSTVLWNTLLAGYVEHGYNEEALDYAEVMRSRGVPQNVVSYLYTLKSCGKLHAGFRGQKIHSEILVIGLETEIFISTSMIDMYAKCSMLIEAQIVLEKFPHRSVALWTALISGYVEHGCGKQALNCFHQMQKDGISPSAVTFVCTLKACSLMRMADEGSNIHAEILKKGTFEEFPYVGCTLIDMYAKCGHLMKAQDVFDKLVYQDAASWTALIQAYVEEGYASEALDCFKQMQDEGVFPVPVTFICSLRACGSVRAIDSGHEIHVDVTKRGLEREPHLGNTLIDMYSKCGSLKEAHQVFDELLVQDVVSWTALLTGYATHGNSEEVLYCVKKLQYECIYLGPVALVCILKACNSIEVIAKGQEMHIDIAKQGLENELLVGNALIDMYAKCGMLPEAENVFGKLQARDIVSWTTVIAGYAQLGQNNDVFDMFERMRMENVTPDCITFLSILNACSHAGLVDVAMICFKTIDKSHDFTPTLEQFACVIDALARSGLIEEALTIVQKMPIHPTFVIWLIILGACRNWGNVKLGRQAFEHAISLDEKDSAPYVCMSNIYMDARMEADAKLVEVMRIGKQAQRQLVHCVWIDEYEHLDAAWQQT